METWRSESSCGRQIVVALACLVAGLALSLATYRALADRNTRAAFLLGVLLAAGGVVGLLLVARQIVVVDPASRSIRVEDTGCLGRRRRTIGFDEIVGIDIGFLGKRSNLVTWYYLVLRLADGEHYALFAPGRFFPGASDRAIVEGWRRRLARYLALPEARQR